MHSSRDWSLVGVSARCGAVVVACLRLSVCPPVFAWFCGSARSGAWASAVRKGQESFLSALASSPVCVRAGFIYGSAPSTDSCYRDVVRIRCGFDVTTRTTAFNQQPILLAVDAIGLRVGALMIT